MVNGECSDCPEGYVNGGLFHGYQCIPVEPTPAPTNNPTPTPFRKIGKERATTEDISFSYAETDSQTGSNTFYSKIETYADGARRAATIYIDVNGKSWPNSFGRDVFAFVLDQDGHLYPYGSEKVAQIVSSGNLRGEEQLDNTWRGATERYGCTKKGTYNGLGCTARLVENHFKVDY
jgi:hypothetical protein